MKRELLVTMVALTATFALSTVHANDSASAARGGRLYDNWIAETKSHAPIHANPVFKIKQARAAVPDTWRCVGCHGWDYKGIGGVIGINSRQKADPTAIVELLKDANHGYEELLDENDRLDLANFVISGQVDMNRLVGLAQRLNPGQTSAGKIFATVCAVCHGLEGDRLREIAPLGDSARQRPAEIMHVALNGHPGGNMPALRTLGEDAAVNMLAYLQTLRSLNLVVRSMKTITYQAMPRSNLFQRKTTGDALISAMPLRMRCFRSSLDVTRMCRRNVRAILEKAHSIRLSHEPCLGV